MILIFLRNLYDTEWHQTGNKNDRLGSYKENSIAGTKPNKERCLPLFSYKMATGTVYLSTKIQLILRVGKRIFKDAREKIG